MQFLLVRDSNSLPLNLAFLFWTAGVSPTTLRAKDAKALSRKITLVASGVQPRRARSSSRTPFRNRATIVSKVGVGPTSRRR